MLRFADSFDHLASADLTMKWTTTSGTLGTNVVVSSGNGRRSTSCLRITSGVNLIKTIDAQATWIVGFAFKADALPAAALAFFALLDAGTVQVDLRLNTDGTLAVTRNGTVLATSSNAITTGTFMHVELKVTISDAAGAAEVRVNGSSSGWVSVTGVDTKNTANASANQIRFLGVTGRTIDFDDLVVCDGTGSANNDFRGDCRVDAYLPEGNGNSSQLTGSDADSTDNYLLVDESAPDGDSTYVESDTATEKDTYAFPAMSHTPSSIFGLQINMIAKKDDAGARSIAAVTRSGGSDTDGSSQALSTSYVDYREISETDPDTSSAWTKTGFGNAEFGVKVAA